MDKLTTEYLPALKLRDEFEEVEIYRTPYITQQVITCLPCDDIIILTMKGTAVVINYKTGEIKTNIVENDYVIEHITHIKDTTILLFATSKDDHHCVRTSSPIWKYDYNTCEKSLVGTHSFIHSSIETLKHPLYDNIIYIQSHQTLYRYNTQTGEALHQFSFNDSWINWIAMENIHTIMCGNGVKSISLDAMTLRPLAILNISQRPISEHGTLIWVKLFNWNKPRVIKKTLSTEITKPKARTSIFDRFEQYVLKETHGPIEIYASRLLSEMRNGNRIAYPEGIQTYRLPRAGYIKTGSLSIGSLSSPNIFTFVRIYDETPVTESKYIPRIHNARQLIHQGTLRDGEYNILFKEDDTHFDASDTNITEENIFKIRRQCPHLLTINLHNCPFVTKETKDEFDRATQLTCLTFLAKSKIFISMDINDELNTFLQEQQIQGNKKRSVE